MYAIARLSAVRMILETARTLPGETEYYDFDNHAESFQLPEKDLVGLVGFSLTEDDPFHDFSFGVAVMTYGDQNLGRMTDFIDLYYDRLKAKSRFKIYRLDGSEAGYEAVIFNGTSAEPVSRVDARPTTSIQVSGRLGLVRDLL